MSGFVITGEENAVTASFTTILALIRGAGRRGKIGHFVLAASGTIADQMLTYALMRFTVAPTVTAVVPERKDLADGAAVMTAGENASAEGTYTAASELFDAFIHHRQTFQWFAPENPEGYLLIPDTAAAGIGARVLHATFTGPARCTMHFLE